MLTNSEQNPTALKAHRVRIPTLFPTNRTKLFKCYNRGFILTLKDFYANFLARVRMLMLKFEQRRDKLTLVKYI